MTPAEFYAARLDELEDLAKRAAFGWGAEWRTETAEEDWSVVRAAGKRVMFGCEDGDVTRHIAANDPAHILADIAAKRAVLRLAEAQFQPHAVMDGMGWEQYENGLTAAYRAVVSHLIQPFATHPDFDESWKL